MGCTTPAQAKSRLIDHDLSINVMDDPLAGMAWLANKPDYEGCML